MFAQTYKNSKIEKKLLKVANHLNLNGVINIQFKIKSNQVKIFDINPRVSSTVKMRDLIGFKDCLWWIQDKLKIKKNLNFKLSKNKTIIKFFDEKVI